MAHHHHNFDFEEPPPEPKGGNIILRKLRQNAFTLATLAGVLLGGIIGICLKNYRSDWTRREIMYIGFPGEIFLQTLKGLIIPLIVSSLVSAIANLDLSLSSKIATRAVAYYLTTTFAAVILGMVVVTTIQPGKGVTIDADTTKHYEKSNTTTTDTLLDLVRNMFPPNIIEATMFQFNTVLKLPANTTDPKIIEDMYKWNIAERGVRQNTNIMGLVVVSAAWGIAIAQLREEARVMAEFFDNVMSISMKITQWVIFFSPVGIVFLVMSEILKMENFGQAMKSLGYYFGTVMLGLGIQAIVVLPLLYFLLTRRNPITLVKNLSEAIITGFGTASSSATLPVTIRCLEDKQGVDSRVARFCLPIGSTINMDGTALYEAVAAIFIAQVSNRPLDFGSLIAISVTATAASIGAAGIPQAGLVTMVMVLDTLGLPAEKVGIILAVDWFLDRFRTAINIMGDSFGAAIVYYRSQSELGMLPKKSLISIGSAQQQQQPVGNSEKPPSTIENVEETRH